MPRSLVYATFDGWRRHTVEKGHHPLEAALRQAKRIRPAVGDLHGPRPMGRELVEEGLASSFAPLKIVIHLRTCRHVDVGGSESCRLDASITDADNEEN